MNKTLTVNEIENYQSKTFGSESTLYKDLVDLSNTFFDQGINRIDLDKDVVPVILEPLIENLEASIMSMIGGAADNLDKVGRLKLILDINREIANFEIDIANSLIDVSENSIINSLIVISEKMKVIHDATKDLLGPDIK